MILFSRLLWDFFTVLKMVAVFAQLCFTKIIITWLAKQKRPSTSVPLDLFYEVAVPKKIGTFLRKYLWCSPMLIKSQGNAIKAGIRHFLWIFLTSYLDEPLCRAYVNFFFWFLDAFLVLFKGAQKNIYFENFQKKVREEGSFLVKVQALCPKPAP